MYDNFYEEIVNLDRDSERQQIEFFLEKNGLVFESVEYTVRVVDYKGSIVGTGSTQGEVIKCVAVGSDYRESVVFSRVISHLLEYFSSKNINHCFVFTRPSSVSSFLNLGFKEIARAEPLFALLEYGLGGLKTFKEYLRRNRFQETGAVTGAVVVNCNPFTLGHRYVIEQAAKNSDYVYVIVVEEDRSIFPFDIRFELVRKGTDDLKNVKILAGGKYVVSSTTFPTYFLKNESPGDIERFQAELDIRVFGAHIASELGINKRFAGTEDYCKTTAGYNDAMQKVLPEFGIEHIIVKRKRTGDDLIVSASHVRKAIREDDWDMVKQLVPKTTYDFLVSSDAENIISKLKSSDTRH
ncbi:MAG: [citrate (pro-3S)-lyase] ligase [bacterium]|nr:[citrate (pro-3S)-lyase] ligase [bacterium]